MVKTKNLCKLGAVVAFFAICISSMVFALSFATEGVATDDQSNAIEENVIAAEATESEVIANATTEQAKKSDSYINPHFSFDIKGYNDKMFVNHNIFEYESGETVVNDYYYFDQSKGVDFKDGEFTSYDIVNTNDGIEIECFGDTFREAYDVAIPANDNNLEYFCASFVDDNNTITLNYAKFDKFIINAYLCDDSDMPIKGYDLTFYNAQSKPVNTITTNDEGYALFEFDSKDDALGYFYDYNPTTGKGLFDFSNISFTPYKLNSSIGYCETQLSLDDVNSLFTGADHHSHFVFSLIEKIDEVELGVVHRVMPDFICSFDFAPRMLANKSLDYNIEININQEGSFVYNADITDDSLHVNYIWELLPVSEDGYEFESWDILDKNYKAGNKVDIDLSTLDVLEGVANYQISTPQPEPQPQPTPGEVSTTAQTSDSIPVACVVALGLIATIAFSVARKKIVKFN